MSSFERNQLGLQLFNLLPPEIILDPEYVTFVGGITDKGLGYLVIASKGVLDTIKRRPCTDKDLSEILNLHINELNKYLSELMDDKRIEADKRERGLFFKIKES